MLCSSGVAWLYVMQMTDTNSEVENYVKKKFDVLFTPFVIHTSRIAFEKARIFLFINI